MAEPFAYQRKQDEILDILNEDSFHEPEGSWGSENPEADLYAHPGFSEYAEFLDRTIGLSESDYERYRTDIENSMRQAVSSGTPIAVLYPEDFEFETRAFIDDMDMSDNAVMIPTYSSTGGFFDPSSDPRPVTGSDENGLFSGEALYAGLIDSIAEDGVLRVHGELGQQCYDAAKEMASGVENGIEKDFDVEEGHRFPENRFIPLPFRNIKLPF